MRVRGTVVVLLLVVLTGCDGDPAAPSPTSAPPTLVVGTPTLDPSGIEPCPAPETEPERVEGALPAGAISVRLCPGPAPRTDLEDDWPSIQAAPDAVTLGAGHLAATLNGLPDLDLGRDEFCTQQGRPRIMAVFGYADGSSRTVTYGYGDCGVLELTDPGDFPSSGPLFREGADIFFTAYVDQLLAQRASLSPPTAAPPTPSCVPNIRPQSLVPAGRVPLATAAYCALDDRGRWHRAPIPTPLAKQALGRFRGHRPRSRREQLRRAAREGRGVEHVGRLGRPLAPRRVRGRHPGAPDRRRIHASRREHPRRAGGAAARSSHPAVVSFVGGDG